MDSKRSTSCATILFLLLLCLCMTCGCQVSQSCFASDSRRLDISAPVLVSGPLPIQTSDGNTALHDYFGVGLVEAGSNTIVWPLDHNTSPKAQNTGNLNCWLNWHGIASEAYLPSGQYQLAVFSTTEPLPQTISIENIHPRAIEFGPVFSLDYNDDKEQLSPLEVNFTGPAPYGSISGRLLISGNGLIPANAQLVLRPKPENQGGDPCCTASSIPDRLVWRASSFSQHGQVWFTVPALSYGTYNLSYTGRGLEERDEPLTYSSISVKVSEQQPNRDGNLFELTNVVRPRPALELGIIRGTLGLWTAPAADDVYCIEACWDELLDADTATDEDCSYRLARYLCTAADFNETHVATFWLGWLSEGQYTVSIYRLAKTAGKADELMGEFGPFPAQYIGHEVSVSDSGIAITLPNHRDP